MDLNQIRYFLHLAETLNFTEAARRSGVSQPSLTKAIRRLEDELGGPLMYRDGKDSRLTMLGREVQVEFMRIEKIQQKVIELAENSVLGRSRVLNIGVGTTIAPRNFTQFIERVLAALPDLRINIHPLAPTEGAAEVLSGRYDGCILPTPPADSPKLAVQPLFCERYVLATALSHPLARQNEIPPEELSRHPYVDRLHCEFRTQLVTYFMDRDIVLHPRFSSEREDWVQQVVAAGDGICLMPERSAIVSGLAGVPIANLDLEREVVLVTVSGSGSARELRQMFRMAAQFDWALDYPPAPERAAPAPR
ncbi:LysR family transcriptional regulator [Oceaniglobus trochenteri]|uniref:LysR family transcriptional regulator n=1 Tax=Oceaniglobus trochenteri TaxID=2763260 RepID=UPI001CFF79AC|nr:LysR family transcriptional regulator [Oceaniglobus trochenteri]